MGRRTSSGGHRRHERTIEVLEGRLLLSRIVYVDDSAPAGGTGASWDTAWNDLQPALLAAVADDVIRVAQGTYYPALADRTASFVMKNNVAIVGGYAGLGAADRDARDVAAFPTILSGSIRTGADNDNTCHILIGSGTDATAVLDGFTIRNSWGNDAGFGGGLQIEAGSPTIRDCTFIDNYALHGGAISNKASSPTIVGCDFISNNAHADGGAIFNMDDSRPLITSCVFLENSSQPGGAVYNLESSPVFRDCEFTGNTSSTAGGAIHSRSDSEMVLINCTFTRNSTSGGGGAIFNHMSPIWSNDNYRSHYTNCTFEGNRCSDSGGAVCNVYTNVILNNCLFSGNEAWDYGGGVANMNYSASRYNNCTFVGNQATHETFSAGGAFINNDHSSPILNNCIMWGNVGTAKNSISNSATCTVNYSDIEGGWSTPGEHNFDLDPRFVRMPDAGADGEWSTADDDYGDARLRPDSPCIDAGVNGGVRADAGDVDLDGNTAEPIPLDCDGNARFVDHPDVPDTGAGISPLVDLGAYEAFPTESAVTLRGSAAGDHFYLRCSEDGTEVHIWRDIAPVGAFERVPLAGLLTLAFDTEAGDDSLTVDFSLGTPIPPGGLFFLAGADDDDLILTNLQPDADVDVGSDQVTYSTQLIACDDAEETILAGTGNIHIDSLTLGGDADPVRVALQPNGGRGLFVNALAIADHARLDLADNDLVVHGGDACADVLAGVAGWIASARNAAEPWGGDGITSSAARALADGITGLASAINLAEAGPLCPDFDGEHPGVDCILVKYTWNGDANLDGVVDGEDYLRIDQGFMDAGTSCLEGNFDYRLGIDGDDFYLIDAAFLQQAAIMPADVPASVPEPVAMLDGSARVLGAVIAAPARIQPASPAPGRVPQAAPSHLAELLSPADPFTWL